MSRIPSPDIINAVSEGLNYNPETGIIVWKIRDPSSFTNSTTRSADVKCRAFNKQFAGSEFGHVTSHGYRAGNICGRGVYAHHIAWFIHYGYWPEGVIDHINGDKTDNKINNLRCVNQSTNMKNKTISRRNKSGIVGVFLAKSGNYFATIGSEGVNIHLGTFRRIEDASRARSIAEAELGFSERHGKMK